MINIEKARKNARYTMNSKLFGDLEVSYWACYQVIPQVDDLPPLSVLATLENSEILRSNRNLNQSLNQDL